jgi:hypothetical protein
VGSDIVITLGSGVRDSQIWGVAQDLDRDRVGLFSCLILSDGILRFPGAKNPGIFPTFGGGGMRMCGPGEGFGPVANTGGLRVVFVR